MDKEYIDRKPIINLLESRITNPQNAFINNVLIELLKREPTADVVSVVRCKDCKHFTVDAFNRTVCNRTFTMLEMNNNDFCSYGERKG